MVHSRSGHARTGTGGAQWHTANARYDAPAPGGDAVGDELGDFGQGRAGREDAIDARGGQRGDVGLRDDAPHDHHHVTQVVGLELLEQGRHLRQVPPTRC